LEGVLDNYVEDGVCMLQFADDTIFMFHDSLWMARKMKFILCLFEQLSGMKFNFMRENCFVLVELSLEVRSMQLFSHVWREIFLLGI
jgi:hypothetical protein